MELAQLFAQYGSVLECRVLHNGDMTRGAGALVRMSTLQQASAAIEALNNVSNGTGLPLLVRYNHPLHLAILALSASFILRYERQHLLPYFVHCITCSVQ